MMIGLAVASIVIMAAIAFAHDEIKAFGRGNQNLEMLQTGRAALDLMMRDFTNAGSGIGYDYQSSFPGLKLGGTFSIGPASGGSAPAFTTDNAVFTDPMWGYTTVNDDVFIRSTEVSTNTVMRSGAEAGGFFFVCNPTRVLDGDMVSLRDTTGQLISIRQVSGLTIGSPCVDCVGTGLCDSFQLAVVPGPLGYTTPGGASDEEWSLGTVATGHRISIWFMTYGPDNFPQLRRAVDTDCARGPACGNLMADNIDTLQVRYFRWDETAVPQNWVLHTGPINTRERFRVDVELVVRSRTMEDQQFHAPVRLALESSGGGTFPPTSPVLNATQRNSLRYQRIVLRSSIQLRNTGAMLGMLR